MAVQGSLLARIPPRLRAVWDMSIPEQREYSGVHEYDGEVADLSPSGIRRGLERLAAAGAPEPDRHDEAQLAATEASLRVHFATAEIHRWNPLVHVDNLDLACYDREYAPPDVRADARRRHLAAWPEAIEASLQSLDAVPAPVASALEQAVEGLADGVEEESALAAHGRLLARLREAAESGPEEIVLGPQLLASLLGEAEALPLDLGRLETKADAERRRLWERLREDCNRYRAGATPRELVPELRADHPDDEGIYAHARQLIDEITTFTLSRDLIPDPGGECLVGSAPPSRRWAMAMMSAGGAYEDDAPAWYYVNPPEPEWSEEEKAEWREVFSATTLPSITAHEVTPGHFAHQRLMTRFAHSHVRKSLASDAFVEGWAHYCEELLVEEGFRRDDPRYAIGVWLESLLRVSRLACALGIHGGTMTLAEATRRMEEDAFLVGKAAESEAFRATYDPTYGRYTWGKLEILAARDEATARWGNRYSHRRFHTALMSLGAPALGLLGDVLED